MNKRWIEILKIVDPTFMHYELTENTITRYYNEVKEFRTDEDDGFRLFLICLGLKVFKKLLM